MTGPKMESSHGGGGGGMHRFTSPAIASSSSHIQEFLFHPRACESISVSENSNDRSVRFARIISDHRRAQCVFHQMCFPPPVSFYIRFACVSFAKLSKKKNKWRVCGERINKQTCAGILSRSPKQWQFTSNMSNPNGQHAYAGPFKLKWRSSV